MPTFHSHSLVAGGCVRFLGCRGGLLPAFRTQRFDLLLLLGTEDAFDFRITLLILTFMIVAWRGLRAAVLAPDRFGSLMAIGLTTMVSMQALINLSVVTSLVPNKGMPLPFVSNGGSSLIINLIGMGILLNISQQASTVAATQVGVDPEA